MLDKEGFSRARSRCTESIADRSALFAEDLLDEISQPKMVQFNCTQRSEGSSSNVVEYSSLPGSEAGFSDSERLATGPAAAHRTYAGVSTEVKGQGLESLRPSPVAIVA
eukprot:632243-Rhodomonas_salina.1